MDESKSKVRGCDGLWPRLWSRRCTLLAQTDSADQYAYTKDRSVNVLWCSRQAPSARVGVRSSQCSLVHAGCRLLYSDGRIDTVVFAVIRLVTWFKDVCSEAEWVVVLVSFAVAPAVWSDRSPALGRTSQRCHAKRESV